MLYTKYIHTEYILETISFYIKKYKKLIKKEIILIIMENVIIQSKEGLEKVKQQIKKEGKNKLHVISDFDGSFTKAFVDGKKVPSLISILRDGPYLTSDYREKAHTLYNKYHPIEIDSTISISEKKKAMLEWWTKHFSLLIRGGLNKRDLEMVIQDRKAQFREGALDFIDFLHENDVPLIILPSSGLGDAISMLLEKQGRLYNNIYIISNFYIWNKKGRAIGVKEPIIHSMNKEEISIKGYPVFNVIKNRKNILLLGNSLGDLGMVKGFNYSNIIKVGLLNENVDENLEHYKKNFDIVLLNNTNMNYVNEC